MKTRKIMWLIAVLLWLSFLCGYIQTMYKPFLTVKAGQSWYYVRYDENPFEVSDTVYCYVLDTKMGYVKYNRIHKDYNTIETDKISWFKRLYKRQ